MADPLDQQEAALEQWLRDPVVRAELERKNWRAAFGRYPRLNLTEDPVPWATPPRDLAAARVMLVGSAGLSAPGQGQPAFNAADPYGDYSWRVLPRDLDLAQTTIAHEHYDHAAAEHDRDSVYPLDRLRALAQQGVIGGLTPEQLSFMGYLPNWQRVRDELAPALAEQVAQQQPDAVLLVPV